MILLKPCRRFAGVVISALTLLAPCALAAQTPAPAKSQVPSLRELARISPTGNYLAARHAGAQRDASAAAAFFRAALRSDPRNGELLERAFIATLTEGDIDESIRLAERLIQLDRTDRIARLVLGIRALKQKQYAVARQNFMQSNRGPLTDLTATLLAAWAMYGTNDAKGAVDLIDRLSGPDWYPLFKELHAGLILDLSGSKKEAGKRYEHAYQLNSSSLRLVEAYSSWLSRTGSKDEALKVLATFDKAIPGHPLIKQEMEKVSGGDAAPANPSESVTLRAGQSGELVKRLQTALGIKADGAFGPVTEAAVKAFQQKNGIRVNGIAGPNTLAKLNISKPNGIKGEPLPPLVTNPQDGAAEVLYGLGSALGRRGDDDPGLVYLQLALYLSPNHALSLISLADLYEQIKKPLLAIKTYEAVPQDSPLRRNAEIQLAADLDSIDRADEAKKRLEKLIAERPNDIEAIMMLGNILRGRKDYAECAKVYSRGIATITAPVQSQWPIFYFRGICYEREKQWAQAEADLKKALELYPDQPHVLNYLGYSWIDQGINLDEGMKMIRRAVEQRPEDGYIVDSLGWVYYRLGDYQEALKNLERAVELKPDDPTINDHLGDVYWRLGRTLEAQFQWSHARDLKPEADELDKIKQKLKTGLADEPSSAADAAKQQKKPGNGG
ncbi:MAG TPA: tetratricopeptide repeat protein [Xanthobacteraceae bacterium]|nr:tetratricopeptide repeat protein [Xanthobacteraceae bacterium]